MRHLYWYRNHYRYESSRAYWFWYNTNTDINIDVSAQHYTHAHTQTHKVPYIWLKNSDLHFLKCFAYNSVTKHRSEAVYTQNEQQDILYHLT